jgi:hypothetical protein
MDNHPNSKMEISSSDSDFFDMTSDKNKTFDSHQKVDEKYKFIVDDVEYQTQEKELTGSQIMDIAGIPHETGIVQILEDGTQLQIKETDIISLKDSKHKFKTAPRFKRG